MNEEQKQLIQFVPLFIAVVVSLMLYVMGNKFLSALCFVASIATFFVILNMFSNRDKKAVSKSKEVVIEATPIEVYDRPGEDNPNE